MVKLKNLELKRKELQQSNSSYYSYPPTITPKIVPITIAEPITTVLPTTTAVPITPAEQITTVPITTASALPITPTILQQQQQLNIQNQIEKKKQEILMIENELQQFFVKFPHLKEKYLTNLQNDGIDIINVQPSKFEIHIDLILEPKPKGGNLIDNDLYCIIRKKKLLYNLKNMFTFG